MDKMKTDYESTELFPPSIIIIRNPYTRPSDSPCM